VGGRTYKRYDRWESREFPFLLNFERDTLGGVLRPTAGIRIGYVDVKDYSGREIDGAIQEKTRLREDADAGKISGFDGGWVNFLKLGLTYDTRDYERDPTEGMVLQTTAEISTRYLGSDFDYQLVTTSAAGFWSPFGQSPRLVLAGRALYSMQFGDVPFFQMNTLASNQFDTNGLGGFRALRGFKRNRFVGDSVVMASGEARWSFAETHLGSQHLRFMLTGFGDIGRAHDGVRLDFADWRGAAGAGLRLAWNLATIISFDLAVSDEDKIFYLEVGHPF
jgi:outer membrane protein assembly factor BamA